MTPFSGGDGMSGVEDPRPSAWALGLLLAVMDRPVEQERFEYVTGDVSDGRMLFVQGRESSVICNEGPLLSIPFSFDGSPGPREWSCGLGDIFSIGLDRGSGNFEDSFTGDLKSPSDSLFRKEMASILPFMSSPPILDSEQSSFTPPMKTQTALRMLFAENMVVCSTFRYVVDSTAIKFAISVFALLR